MPNWCSNTLLITGDTSTLVQLKSIIEQDSEEGLLEAIAPIGEYDRETAISKWGTKWDVSSEGLEYTDNGDGTSIIEGYFDSAWSPPVEAFTTLAQHWASCYIELKYFEPGMCFIGVWDSEGGDAYYDDIGAPAMLNTTAEEDPVLHGLMEDFNVWDWFDSGEEMYEDDTLTLKDEA
tara:strand:- start:542 stop:1072 length:531 start_codon:yes stop_codon:yes gene_type:complete